MRPTTDPPTIFPVIQRFEVDTGRSSSDGITQDDSLVFFGTAEPEASVELVASGFGVLGNTVANSNGQWTLDATSIRLPEGTFEITAITNSGGQELVSDSIFVTIDTTAPANIAILKITEDTGSSDEDGLTSDGSLIIDGIAEPNSLIELNEASLGLLGSAIVGSDGTWSIDLSNQPLARRYLFVHRLVRRM